MDLEEGGAASWHEPGSLNDCVEPRSLLLLTSQHPSNLEWDVLPVIHKLLYLATNDFLTYCSVTTVQCTVLYITVHVLYCNNGLPCPLCVCAHTCMHTHTHSVMTDSASLWTVAHQAPLFMEFSRQEYWNGLPFPPPGDLPNAGITPASPALAGGSFTSEPPGKPTLPIRVV